MKIYDKEEVIYEIIPLLKYHSNDKYCLKFANLLINKATNEKTITLSKDEIHTALFKEESNEINFIILNTLKHLKADLTGINFSNKKIKGINFIGLEGVEINLDEVFEKDLTDVSFGGVTLTGRLDSAKLCNTNFTGYIGEIELNPEKVKEQSIKNCKLAGVTITGSLDGIEINGVDFTDAKGDIKVNPQRVPNKDLMGVNFSGVTFVGDDNSDPSFKDCLIYNCKFRNAKGNIVINLNELKDTLPKLAICDLTGVIVEGKTKSNYEARHCVREDGAVLFEDVGDDLFGSYYYDENGNHVHIYLFESMMWDSANSCWKYIPKSLEPNLRLEIEYKQKEEEPPKRKFLSRFRKKRNNNEN